MVIMVGINGFGRIGKVTFLQLLEQQEFCVRAINCNLAPESIEKYINNDSTHGVRTYKVIVIDTDTIKVGSGPTTSSYRTIKLLRSRIPEELAWRDHGVKILFDTTGAFMTSKELARHDVDHVILSAPPKDLGTTPMHVYGVNDRDYSGERIISAASCTTNCIAPFLAAANQIAGGVSDGSFITVHAATASQSIVDEAHDKKRTNRSIFNNIIPHTTGASKTVDWLFPDLKGKIIGTSIRVPINNVSMVDCNLNFNQPITKEAFFERLEENTRYPDVVKVHKEKGVSSDFIGTASSSIVDYHSTFQLTPTSIKFCLWYDNEWSYAAQMIHMARTIAEVTAPRRVRSIRDVPSFSGRTVFLRVDFNCPLSDDGSVADNFRVQAALYTLQHILRDKPKRVVIASHFGRPTAEKRDPNFSMARFVPILASLLREAELDKVKGKKTECHESGSTKSVSSPSYREVHFVSSGLNATEKEVSVGGEGAIYLLENTRFHAFETKPIKKEEEDANSFACQFQVDVFCNEAFSVSHRKHTSITGIEAPIKCVGFQLLREVMCLDRVLGRAGEVSVAIIGGSKVSDKLPMLKNLSRRVDMIAIGGNNVNAITADPSLLDDISNGRAKILLLDDGFGNASPDDEPPMYFPRASEARYPLFDAGPISLNKLAWWVNKADIIFWNGALGITEHPFYKNGTEALVHLLGQCPGDVVIGGGDTAGFVQGSSGVDYSEKYDFYHISTGGGASIEYLTAETLPGIAYHDKAEDYLDSASEHDEYRQVDLRGKARRKPSFDSKEDSEKGPENFVEGCIDDLKPPGKELKLPQGSSLPPSTWDA